jgi:uncharacterized repeat protein (TIGR01451 family)
MDLGSDKGRLMSDRGCVWWRVASRLVRRIRVQWLVVALAAGAGTGLVVGTSARGDTICANAGDIQFCAQWGVDGYATRLVVKNTGTQTISSFTFTLPAGTTTTGAAGNTGCKTGPASNQISCTTPIALGQTQFVDILSNPTPAVGSSGTLMMIDGSGISQAGQNVTLQASSVCHNGTSTTTCTISTTTTSTAGCAPIELDILKTLEPGVATWLTVKEVPYGSHHYMVADAPAAYADFPTNWLSYIITVANVGQCPATDVRVIDQLPGAFHYMYAKITSGSGANLISHPKAGQYGGKLEVEIASLAAGDKLEITVAGDPIRDSSSTNTAHLSAPGFGGKQSTIYVKLGPAPHATITGVTPTSVQGTASAPHGAHVTGVQVAIQQLHVSAPASDARVHCTWLRNTKAKPMRFRSQSCTKPPIWLKASRGKHWRITFKALPRGRYFVLAEALGKHGLSADTFTKGVGDSGILTVR